MIVESGTPGAELSTALALCVATAATSFVFSSARYAIESVSRGKLVRLLAEPKDVARFERYFELLDRTLIGTLLLMVLSDALFGLALFVIVRSSLPVGFTITAIFASAALAAIYLVLCGRVLARTLVENDPEQIVIRMLPWLHRLGALMKPLTAPITAFRRGLMRSLGRTDPDVKQEAFTDELKATLEEGEREGVVKQEEAAIIENVVEFRDLDVRQVMTPRTDLDWVDGGTPVSEALQLASEKGHARLPVANEDSDHIVGVFYVRDVIDKLDEFERMRHEPVRSVCRQAHFVPVTKHVVELLKEFRQHKIQIAIVLDEHGGTAGLVTVTDILEAIVGEIHDEHDPDEGEVEIEVVDSDHAVVDGRTRIAQVNESLSIDLPEKDGVDTIGGLVFSTLGRVPHAGETLHHEGVEIRVVGADERRVKKLELKVLSRGEAR